MKVRITQGRQAGLVQVVNDAEGQGLVNTGFGVAVNDDVAVPVVAPIGEPARAAVHVGGGWYQLPDGTRVRGKAAAERLLG